MANEEELALLARAEMSKFRKCIDTLNVNAVAQEKKTWAKSKDPERQSDFASWVWANKWEKRFPMLAPVAKLLLGMPATSVPSERTWSTTKLIDTRLRTSLGDEVFGDLIFIAKNLPESGKFQDFMSTLLKLNAATKAVHELVNITEDGDHGSDSDD